jgi:magnesium transporter
MRKIIAGPNVTWVDIQDPAREDIEYLKKNFKLHPLIFDELILPGNHPKLKKFSDLFYLSLFLPVYNKEKRETRPRELDIIISKNIIITSHYKSILPLKALFDKLNIYKEIRNQYMSENSGTLLFYILEGFCISCLTKLARVDKKLDQIEKDIFKGKEKNLVTEISYVKTDIINLWKIISPQREVLKSLSEEGIKILGEEIQPYFIDILENYDQAKNNLEAYKETILSLENTNESLLSTKTNEIIRILTVFSVIFLPITLLVNMWGMNLTVPFEESTRGFLIITGIIAAMTIFMIIYFKKKKWL